MAVECFRCHHETPARAAFCPSCGVRLPPVCGGCGAVNRIDARYCTRCGTNLALAREAPPLSQDPHAPRSLAERMLSERSALEGERKQVTILFADMRSSLEMVAGRDPEDARGLLDGVLERLIEAVRRYEGTVNQVMGDGIMALFGAPLALEDHALRACYAALRMQEAVQRYGSELQQEGAPAPRIRVGINSGEVVVRSIGSDLHMDYTAVGQATHLAARMERLAEPGSSLLTAATARLVAEWIELDSLGARGVDGLAEPVEVYRLVGARPLRSRFESAAARGLSGFVGRATELATLERLLEQAAGGQGQVVALVGEPGQGKSRLIWEFARQAKLNGWQVLEAGALPHGIDSAYLPIAHLVGRALEVEEEDDVERVREKVAAALAERSAPSDMLAALLALLDVPSEDRTWQALDAQQRRRRIIAAVRQLLLHESRRRPLCVVVEDLQWLDSESQAVLDELVQGLARSRVCMIVSYRPEFRHGWEDKSYYARLRVEPLTGDGARKFLDGLLGSDGSLAGLKHMLIARTDGNPFFLEEGVRHLAETGVLGGVEGARRLAGSLAGTEVPATVHAVLASRIDRLPAARKALLETAAVIGKDVPVALLERVTGLEPEYLRRELTELQRAEFLYELRLFPEQVYTFKHAITTEVAYRGLLRERRRALHAQIMTAIEALHADRLAEHAEDLSYHALRGEVWDKAFAYGRVAGLRALERSAARSAVAAFERALDALGRCSGSPTHQQAVELRLDLRAALSPLGEFGPMIRYLQEAEALARKLPDPGHLGLVSAFLANYFILQGQTDRALECGRRALEIGAAKSDRALRVLANASIATIQLTLGDYTGGIGLAERNLELLTGGAEYDRFGMGPLPSVYSRVILALSHAELGQFAQAAAHADDAMRIAETIDHPHSVILTCQAAGTMQLRRGDAQAAIALLERGLALSETADIPAPLPQLAAQLSSAYALEGRGAQALEVLERGVRVAVAANNAFGHMLRSGYRSEVLLALGRSGEALPLAERYLEITRFIKARGLEGWANRLYAAVAASLGAPENEQALAAYERALAIAGERGMRPLAAHCHFGLGLLAGRSGRAEEGARHLREARSAFAELGMTRWAERVEVEGSQRVPLAL
jgi:class 3 adenylate cyclase/tetratricopeptide (TPR) repeat protein